MKGANLVKDGLDNAANVLEQLTKLLSGVGIDLPLLGKQLGLLAILLATILPLALLTWRKRSMATAGAGAKVPKKASALKRGTGIGGTAVLAIAAAFVVVGILDQATTPSRLAGTVTTDGYLVDLKVTLLGFKDTAISADSGFVDSTNGRFVVQYSPLVNGRVRQMKISAQGCSPKLVEMSRTQARANVQMTLEYVCERLQ